MVRRGFDRREKDGRVVRLIFFSFIWVLVFRILRIIGYVMGC